MTDFAIPYGYNPVRSVFPSYIDNRHLITFGPTRSGKGATVIVQALLRVPHSVICIDPKGQNAAITARRRRELGQDVHFLNPFNELGLATSRFNPLAHLSIDEPNLVADVSSLAEALIISDGKESHWSDSARSLVKALLLHLIETKGRDATLIDMRRLLTQDSERFGSTVFDMMHSPRGFISQPAAQFQGESREIQSIISTARTQTAFLDDPAMTAVLGGSDFNMVQLKERPTTVFLILPGRYMEAYARFFRLVITSAIDQLTARPGGHRTLFLLDEFATLQNLGAVAKAFGFGAGYGIQLWPFLQDVPQLKTIYGDKWETLLANAGLVQFFTPADMTTAEYLEKRSGKTTRVRRGMSVGEVTPEQAGKGLTGLQQTYATETVPFLTPEVSMSLSRDRQVLFFADVHNPTMAFRFPYWKIRRLSGLYDPDPFHQTAGQIEFIEDEMRRLNAPQPSPVERIGHVLGQAMRRFTGHRADGPPLPARLGRAVGRGLVTLRRLFGRGAAQ